MVNLDKIASGESKATKLNNPQVLELFFNYDKIDHIVESSSFSINDNVLFHNGRIEIVKRKKDRLLIRNSQELQRSGGIMNHVTCIENYSFAYRKNYVSLPIEEISRQINFEGRQGTSQIQQINDVELIEIIDKEYDEKYKNSDDEYITGTIFKIKDRYFWHRRDERHFYLIELPCKVTNFKDANESLMPNIVLKSKDVKRQGDFYFIPVDNDFKQYDKLHYKKYWNLNYENQDKFNVEIDIISDLLLWKFSENFQNTLDKNETITFTSVINDIVERQDFYLNQYPKTVAKKQDLQYIINKIYKLIPYTKKELIRYEILDSNHIADNSYFDDINQFVKGKIYHKNNDHSAIKLDSWHLVRKNEAIQGIQVDPNRSSGFD